jgi:hypothetical protein
MTRMKMNEESLEFLLKFIRGDVGLLGIPGIHTYPGREDKADIYEGCLELERRGLICRTVDEPDYAYFLPVDDAHGDRES